MSGIYIDIQSVGDTVPLPTSEERKKKKVPVKQKEKPQVAHEAKLPSNISYVPIDGLEEEESAGIDREEEEKGAGKSSYHFL